MPTCTSFYCPGFTPEAGYAAAQHAALVARLLADGWVPTGVRGRGWWNASFRRAI